MRKIHVIVFLLLLAFAAQAQNLKLWYSKPAQHWTEALPLGNSRLGVMVFGGTSREELQLNEETFWSGGPYNNNNPKGREALPKVRELVFQNKFVAHLHFPLI